MKKIVLILLIALFLTNITFALSKKEGLTPFPEIKKPSLEARVDYLYGYIYNLVEKINEREEIQNTVIDSNNKNIQLMTDFMNVRFQAISEYLTLIKDDTSSSKYSPPPQQKIIIERSFDDKVWDLIMKRK